MWWTCMCMCMSTCMCMYPSHPRSDSGSPLRRARRVSEEEREVKSQSRALREVFGNEARVKIHSSCVVFSLHPAHARLLVEFILGTPKSPSYSTRPVGILIRATLDVPLTRPGPC